MMIQKMKGSFVFVLIAVFSLQVSNGMPEKSGLSETGLHDYASELMSPFLEKNSQHRQALQDYWAQYQQNIQNIDSKVTNLVSFSSKSDDNNDTCIALQNAMADAQEVVNKASVIGVEVFQKMLVAINNPPSCGTINIFAAISCVAHKGQDIRDIYKEYKDDLVTNDIAAAKAIGAILLEFAKCLKRL